MTYFVSWSIRTSLSQHFHNYCPNAYFVFGEKQNTLWTVCVSPFCTSCIFYELAHVNVCTCRTFTLCSNLEECGSCSVHVREIHQSCTVASLHAELVPRLSSKHLHMCMEHENFIKRKGGHVVLVVLACRTTPPYMDEKLLENVCFWLIIHCL